MVIILIFEWHTTFSKRVCFEEYFCLMLCLHHHLNNLNNSYLTGTVAIFKNGDYLEFLRDKHLFPITCSLESFCIKYYTWSLFE